MMDLSNTNTHNTSNSTETLSSAPTTKKGADSTKDWTTYPMGPAVTEWLRSLPHSEGVLSKDASQESHRRDVSEAEKLEFSRYLLEVVVVSKLTSESNLTDLMDELTAMDLPIPVLKLADKYRQTFPCSSNFQFQLLEGVAAMKVEELERAELCLRSAQEIIPGEPAPYINLIQVFLYGHRLEECLEWLDAGLTAEPNNLKIWELASVVATLVSKSAGDDSCRLASETSETSETVQKFFIFKLAKKFNSWAGYSLSADLDDEANSQTKATLLDSVYHSGERSFDFLIEYTGALGSAGDFEKIPQIAWQASKSTSSPVPWRLKLHSCQAQLAMDKREHFIKEARQLLLDYNKATDLPDSLISEINSMISQVQDELTEQK